MSWFYDEDGSYSFKPTLLLKCDSNTLIYFVKNGAIVKTGVIENLKVGRKIRATL